MNKPRGDPNEAYPRSKTDCHTVCFYPFMVPNSLVDSVRTLVERVRAEYPGAELHAVLSTAAGMVIKAFVGIEWMERHVLGLTAPTNFFRNGNQSDPYEDRVPTRGV